jgi:DNA-binding NarL/FixJ family response regulator
MLERCEENARIRVLLVDDHVAMRLALRATLHGADGIEVVGEAHNGEKAVELAGRLAPDVVLMDVSMPGLGGMEATRLIRKARPDIRVIGMSMYDERVAGVAMLEAGAVSFLKKTEVRAKLVDAIRIHGRTDSN